MSQSRFVNASEYQVILQRVNQVICQFSNSVDKTGDAIVFMTRIEEKCTTREEFLTVIEKRLDLLSNPNKSQEYVDWFKSRRDNLMGLLKGIKEKVANDSSYLTKFSPSFGKGMQCLDKLLKTDVNTIGHNHMVDLTRIRKAVLELKGEIDNKAKVQESKPQADPTTLYIALLDASNAFNLLNIESDAEKRSALFERISEQKAALESHLATHSATLDATTTHRISTAIQLLTALHRHAAPLGEVDAPPLPLTMIYAVLSDLKTAEWRNVQAALGSSGNSSSDNSNNNGSGSAASDADALQQLYKRRKTSVTLSPTANTSSSADSATVSTTTAHSTTSITLSPADQKLLDSLQSHQNSLETGTQRERTENFLDQVGRNEDAFELFEWDNLLDVSTHAGTVLLNA